MRLITNAHARQAYACRSNSHPKTCKREHARASFRSGSYGKYDLFSVERVERFKRSALDGGVLRNVNAMVCLYNELWRRRRRRRSRVTNGVCSVVTFGRARCALRKKFMTVVTALMAPSRRRRRRRRSTIDCRTKWPHNHAANLWGVGGRREQLATIERVVTGVMSKSSGGRRAHK